MADAYSEFLKRLTEYRTGLLMTQEQIAGKLGMTQTKYSKFERGALKITSDTLHRLKQMGWDVEYILGGVKRRRAKVDIREVCRAYTDVGEESLLRFLAALLTDAAERCGLDTAVRAEVRLLMFRIFAPDDVTAIRTCRDMIGKTQEQMADELGLGVKTYRMYERGEKEMTADLIIAFGQLSGCRASIFLFPEDMEWNIVQYVWSLLEDSVQEEMQVLVIEFVKFLRSLTKKT